MTADRSFLTDIQRAFNAQDIETLLSIFPPEWGGVAARIIESGAVYSTVPCWWAPRWSPVPPTIRKAKISPEAAIIGSQFGSKAEAIMTEAVRIETMLKSVIYRIHDCIHQLWGTPVHSPEFTEDDYYVYKRAVMCGEVAVLALTEFAFCDSLYSRYPQIRPLLDKRNALPMWNEAFPHLDIVQVAQRLDGILHKKTRPRWLRNHAPSVAFADDYVPMLEADRRQCDKHWDLMKAANWVPEGVPNTRYHPDLDGLELTTWMVKDFLHLVHTDPKVDTALRDFNRERRATISPPTGWGT